MPVWSNHCIAHSVPCQARRDPQRQAAESALIAQYNPPCNERLNASLALLLGS